jgi:hypothetical protein
MSNDVFTKHQHDPVPLHRNTMPVAECGVHDATVAGKPCKAIDVPILSCASVWLRVQKEAEAWITDGGKLIADPIQRNRRINQAYAQLWLSDKRFQWAGLAAFASKQVGCGLLHAAKNIEKSQEEIQANHARFNIMNSSDVAAIDIIPSAIGGSSAYMFQQLALGNTTLFLDIYPLHRFYILRGFSALKKCLTGREAISSHILWPVEKEDLEFGKPFTQIIDAFQAIERNQIARSVRIMAEHEQVNILQAVIYNSFLMRRALDANQFSWATGFPTGAAAEIKLTLSAECGSKLSSRTVWFSKNRRAQLYEQNERMALVNMAASVFDALLNSSTRHMIEASISEIAQTGAAR